MMPQSRNPVTVFCRQMEQSGLDGHREQEGGVELSMVDISWAAIQTRSSRFCSKG